MAYRFVEGVYNIIISHTKEGIQLPLTASIKSRMEVDTWAAAFINLADFLHKHLNGSVYAGCEAARNELVMKLDIALLQAEILANVVK